MNNENSSNGIYNSKVNLLSSSKLEYADVSHNTERLQVDPAPPPPPHSGVRGTACVFPKYPVKGVLFVRQSSARELYKKKKGGVFDFSPGDFFKKRGGFSFSLSLDA